jgi:hypothetical protein
VNFLFIRQQHNTNDFGHTYDMTMYDVAQAADGFCYDNPEDDGGVDYGTVDLMMEGA